MEVNSLTQSTATPKPSANDAARPESTAGKEARSASETGETAQSSSLPPVETTAEDGNASAPLASGESQTGNQVDLAV